MRCVFCEARLTPLRLLNPVLKVKTIISTRYNFVLIVSSPDISHFPTFSKFNSRFHVIPPPCTLLKIHEPNRVLIFLSVSYRPDCLLVSNTAHALSFIAFYARWQNCEKRLLASSCLSVRMEQLGYHWTDFHETWYSRVFFENLLRKLKFN